MEANIKIITAAPEMLEKLKEVRQMCYRRVLPTESELRERVIELDLLINKITE